MLDKTYLAIDLKSFYASVECRERGLDPMTTNLVVADASRTEKTICLAVSPSLKSLGIPGRPRLFEVVQRVKEVNRERQMRAAKHELTGSSWDMVQLENQPQLAVDYLVAPPQMARYMDVSGKIYRVYLRHVAPEDIHVYSIDEVFMDITPYLKGGKTTPREFASKIMREVWEETGITATAGIGTNLYLCKVALDIEAKHTAPDQNGARIAQLDETSYRQKLWTHQPITDFWRVGRGYEKKLAEQGLFTMGDIARCSLGNPGEYYNEALLYRIFGVNAELLIDHAWGWEPCTIQDIKAFRPASNSVGSGQVLSCPYEFEKARLVVREMADSLALDLVEKGLVTDQLTLTVGYDVENLTDPQRKARYKGTTVRDRYGRLLPKHGHGTVHLPAPLSSTRWIVQESLSLFDRIANPDLLVRRLNLTANHVVEESAVDQCPQFEQLDLFTDYQQEQKRREEEQAQLKREKRMQETLIGIKKRFGKNAILKGMNLQEGATARERNGKIGGHKA